MLSMLVCYIPQQKYTTNPVATSSFMYFYIQSSGDNENGKLRASRKLRQLRKSVLREQKSVKKRKNNKKYS